MIHFISRQNIDLEKWNACLKNSRYESIYGHIWYLDAICQWDAMVIGDYEAIIVLPYRNKLGISYVYVPDFCQTLGIFSTKKYPAKMVDDLLLKLATRFRFVDFALADIECSLSSNAIANRNVELTLSSKYDDLRARFSSNTKRNITKSAKCAVEVKQSYSPELILKAYLENKAKEVGSSMSDTEQNYLRVIVNEGIEQDLVTLLEAYSNDGDFLGGAVFVKSYSRYLFLFSGLTENGKSQGAMFAVINSFISSHSGEAMILDFEGSNDDGVARFYQGFGGISTTYYRMRLNNLPKLIRWLKD